VRLAEWAAEAIQILLAQTCTPVSDISFIVLPSTIGPSRRYHLAVSGAAVPAERFGYGW
jgi:hypothetical protein